MRRSMSLTFAVLLLLLFSCKENTVTPPPDPPGKQTHIFWPSLADSPWPVFHGDPQSTGRSKYKGPQLGIIDWSYTFNGRANFSFVTVDSGNVLRFTCGGVLFDSTKNISGAALLSLSPQGNLLWKTNLSSPPESGYPEILNSAVIGSDGTMYVGAKNGYLFAIDRDGTIKWKYNAGEHILSGLAGTKIGLDGALYFSTNAAVFALNRDGTLRWKLNNTSPVEFTFSPSVTFSRDGQAIYIGGSQGLFALDLNGNVKWQFEFKNSYGQLFSLVDTDENIYFLTDSNFYSVSSSGVLRWKYSLPPGEFMDPTTAPVMDSFGNLYYNGGGNLYSLDYSGRLRWVSIGTDGGGSHLICDNEGTVYAGSNAGGRIFAIANDGNKKWELPIGANQIIICGPALGSDSHLYILSYPNGYPSTLYAIK